MGRFSDNGLKKSSDEPAVVEPVIEAAPVAKTKEKAAITPQQETKEPENQYKQLQNQETNKPENQYTQAQMKPVNVGGFRVPLIVRAHWQSKAKFSGEKVATELRAFLVERYGLPDGITEDDLMC